MDKKEIDKQRELTDFVGREVYLCQSMLVNDLLKREIFSYDNITNFTHYVCPDCGSTLYETHGVPYYCDSCQKRIEDPQDQETAEIFEWWSCSYWLAEELEKHGECILKTDYGDYWGRSCTGQSISMDNVIETIYDEMKRA